MENQDIMNVNEPAVAYGTNSYADVMMTLYSIPMTREVKRHVGLRLIEETATDSNLAKAFERLDYMAKLEDNWDGYGARRISSHVLDNLRKVLLISNNEDWKYWMISPSANGSLTLQSKCHVASISIGDKEFSYYCLKDDQEEGESHVEFSTLSLLEIMRRII